MKIKPSIAYLLCITVLSLFLAFCAGREKASGRTVHEPLTLVTTGRYYEQFAQTFQKKHPDIQLNVINYSGDNPHAYMQKLLAAGPMPDIYTTSVLPAPELQKNFLVDLSAYDFSKQYAVSQLKDCTIDDAIYLLPSSYGVYGIFTAGENRKSYGRYICRQQKADCTLISRGVYRDGTENPLAQTEVFRRGL